MTLQTRSYAMKRTVGVDFDEADRRARAALEEEGFGIPRRLDELRRS